jgi:hypothetical protein
MIEGKCNFAIIELEVDFIAWNDQYIAYLISLLISVLALDIR